LDPSFPAEYLVGDAGFDGKEFARDVQERFSLHPVIAHKPSQPFARDLPHWKGSRVRKGDLGVPMCAHGHMRRDPNGFCTRRNRRLPMGERESVDRARIRWTCPEDECRNVTTWVKHDPRLYTYLPRAGDSRAARLREEMMRRRNDIESGFSILDFFGCDGASAMRARWADDHGMEWLTSLAMLYITARRLVHHTGDYEQSLQDAIEAGVLTIPTLDNPTPGPSRRTARRQIKRRFEHSDARLPETWLRRYPHDVT
jgi:hypothetical protein